MPEGCGPGSAITILLPVTPKGSKGEALGFCRILGLGHLVQGFYCWFFCLGLWALGFWGFFVFILGLALYWVLVFCVLEGVWVFFFCVLAWVSGV